MIKRLIAIAAIVGFAMTLSIFAVGWLLARPVQLSVGSPPKDLNAQTVGFESDLAKGEYEARVLSFFNEAFGGPGLSDTTD